MSEVIAPQGISIRIQDVDNTGVVRIFLRNGRLCHRRHRHSHHLIPITPTRASRNLSAKSAAALPAQRVSYAADFAVVEPVGVAACGPAPYRRSSAVVE
jgi:hypothetical protein